MYDREKYILTDSPIKKDLLKLFNKDQHLLIFDIGGCEGEESIRYSRIFPGSSIFIFEPLPKNQELIRANIEKYRTSNIKLFPIALSDKETVEKFYVSSGSPDEMTTDMDWDFGNKSSSLLPPDQHLKLVPWVEFKEVIDVRTNTLQNIFNQNKIREIDFIHMDVQGAELKVLTGAETVLQHIKAIWLEVSNVTLYKDQPKREEIENFMKKNGFFLAKTSLENGIGDQMYLNKKYFKMLSIFFLRKYIKLNSKK